MAKIKKLLIANRGEIAVRIARTCKRLGIPSVAVYSFADRDALHVHVADETVCIGAEDPRQSYLNPAVLLAAAEITQADALHPGYGFLSEDHEFARACELCGLVFVGPRTDTMLRWGDKVASRSIAKESGLPLLEGSTTLTDLNHALREAKRLGFPLMLKASGGGGGRGMHAISDAATLEATFSRAREEARKGFGNDAVYLEPLIEKPRHIEFQILGDGEGGVAVLGERECSIQRRHQKVLEETPSTALSDELRSDVSATIRRVMSEMKFRSAGTLEFLLNPRGQLTFIEMNTRIQVEHPITEAVTGIDIVEQQLRVASGQSFSFDPDSIATRGHAIECRINAEDPETFMPSPGLISAFNSPHVPGVRVDGGVYGGFTVPKYYDSLLMKLISHAPTRGEAIHQMHMALDETIVHGIRTNVDLHRRILQSPEFLAGEYSTHFLKA